MSTATAASPQMVTAAPEVIETAQASTAVVEDTPYNTLLWNDPVNTTEQVTRVLMRVLAFDRVRAEAAMWEAHVNNKAVVFSGSRETAEEKALALLGWHLQATVEKA